MKKKLNFCDLPSVISRPLSNSTLYIVKYKATDVYVTQEYGDLCSFLMGFYAGLGYPPFSSYYQISLREKMEYNF